MEKSRYLACFAVLNTIPLYLLIIISMKRKATFRIRIPTKNFKIFFLSLSAN